MQNRTDQRDAGVLTWRARIAPIRPEPEGALKQALEARLARVEHQDPGPDYLQRIPVPRVIDAARAAGAPPFGGSRVEHQDPRERLLMLYGVWVKCLPHQAGKRMLVERCIASCKAAVDARFGFPPRPWRGFEVDVEVQP